MQRFLMRTSILQVVTPDFAEVVTGLEASAVDTTDCCRRAPDPARSPGSRAQDGIRDITRSFESSRGPTPRATSVTRRFARRIERLRPTPRRAIGESPPITFGWPAITRAFDVIDASAKSIIGRGEYLVAAPFVEHLDVETTRASFEVVLSRRDYKEGHLHKALTRAEHAVALTLLRRRPPQPGLAIVNNGRFEDGVATAKTLLLKTSDSGLRGIATGSL